MFDTTHMATSDSVIEILNEPFLSINHSPSQDLIILRWSGYADAANYRRGLDAALEFVKEHRVKRWLADLRNMHAILSGEVKWTNEDWFPRLIAAGALRRMAIMPSSDFFNQQSVERIMNFSSGAIQFEVGYFQDEQDSMEWLFGHAVQNAEMV